MSLWAKLLIWAGACATLCGGCARTMNSDRTLLLTWRQFDGAELDDPQEARYVLDGKPIGRGDSGFLKVLDAIQDVPTGTELWVYPDKSVLNHLSAEGGEARPPHRGTVPFRRNPDLLLKLRAVARERGIAIWYLAGAPGEFVLDNGENLRVQDDPRH